MHVGKKGALVLLAIVVLWAATPALACLTPTTAHRSCCKGMAMQGCDSAAMMHCGECCRMQPADAPLLPGSANAVDHAVGSVPSPAPTALALPTAIGNPILLAFEAPLPPGSPGAGSILRI